MVPQIIVIVLWALGLGYTISKHGDPKIGKHDFWSDLFCIAVYSALLWWGGFWSAFSK